jgi:hypothetical protein
MTSSWQQLGKSLTDLFLFLGRGLAASRTHNDWEPKAKLEVSTATLTLDVILQGTKRYKSNDLNTLIGRCSTDARFRSGFYRRPI